MEFTKVRPGLIHKGSGQLHQLQACKFQPDHLQLSTLQLVLLSILHNGDPRILRQISTHQTIGQISRDSWIVEEEECKTHYDWQDSINLNHKVSLKSGKSPKMKKKKTPMMMAEDDDIAPDRLK